MNEEMEMAYEIRHICACFFLLVISAQTGVGGCVVNDSVLTHVEGYSRMGGKE